MNVETSQLCIRVIMFNHSCSPAVLPVVCTLQTQERPMIIQVQGEPLGQSCKISMTVGDAFPNPVRLMSWNTNLLCMSFLFWRITIPSVTNLLILLSLRGLPERTTP